MTAPGDPDPGGAGGTRSRSADETVRHLEETLEVLSVNLDAFYAAVPAVGMVLAGQLYKLLCDRSRGAAPLAQRVFPNLALAPIYALPDLDGPDGPPMRGLQFMGFLPMEFGNPDVKAGVRAVARHAEPIPLAAWLEQTVAVLTVGTKTIQPTIGALISELRNQDGGGHFDPSVREVVQAVEEFRFVKGGVDYQLGYRLLADVADYLIGHLRSLLEEDPTGAAPTPEST